jgi:transcriptional regulator with XRE-family HTH domain
MPAPARTGFDQIGFFDHVEQHLTMWGLTWSELADLVGVHRNTLHRWSASKGTKKLTVDVVFLLAGNLHMDLNQYVIRRAHAATDQEAVRGVAESTP